MVLLSVFKSNIQTMIIISDNKTITFTKH